MWTNMCHLQKQYLQILICIVVLNKNSCGKGDEHAETIKQYSLNLKNYKSDQIINMLLLKIYLKKLIFFNKYFFLSFWSNIGFTKYCTGLWIVSLGSLSRISCDTWGSQPASSSTCLSTHLDMFVAPEIFHSDIKIFT